MVTRYIILSNIVLFSAVLVEAANSMADNMKNMDPKDMQFAMEYLHTYGYVSSPDPRSNTYNTMEDIAEGVKMVQRLNRLNMTGEIDAKTMEVMKRPRCGLPDFGPVDRMRRRRKRYAHRIHRSQIWQTMPLTYKRLNKPSRSTLTEGDIDAELRKAFDMWSEVIPVTFAQVPDHQDAIISIRFSRGLISPLCGSWCTFDGNGGKIGFAFPNCSDNCPLDSGDIHFDDDEKWTLQYEDETTSSHLLWTALHEIGHVLGLDHSEFGGAIMFSSRRDSRAVLHNDDIRGAQVLYGKPKPKTRLATVKPPAIGGVAGDIDACTSPIDAAFQDPKGDIYFFQEQYYWKVDEYGRLSGPDLLSSTWPELKKRVQAAYVRPDGMTVFFKGRRFWVYNGTRLIEERKEITEYGLPLEMKQLDAVLVWSSDGKTYFFKGDQYWSYSEAMKSIDPGYPKKIEDTWGVPSPVDAAMTKDHQTFFFKDMKLYTRDFFARRGYLQVEYLGSYFLNCSQSDIVAALRGGSATISSGLTFLFTITLLLFNIL